MNLLIVNPTLEMLASIWEVCLACQTNHPQPQPCDEVYFECQKCKKPVRSYLLCQIPEKSLFSLCIECYDFFKPYPSP